MANEVFVVKAIKPKKLQIKKFSQEVLFALKDEEREHQKTLNQTISSWKGDTPRFKSLIDLSKGGDASVLTGPTGNTKGVNKWIWLNSGTRVRHALMSPNWRSKTKPGSFKSGGGRGKVVFISKRIVRPGIKARNWAEKLQKQRRRPFTSRLIKSMQRAGKQAF